MPTSRWPSASRSRYVWDGRGDDGEPAVPPGRYRLLVELPSEDREMVWPRRITSPPSPSDAG